MSVHPVLPMANAGYFAAPERRRQILESAKRVFAARGYHDTNISHICEDLGIARGTLYQHFKSKHEVFSAIVESLVERVRAAQAALPPLELPPGFRATREIAIDYCAGALRTILDAVFADAPTLRIFVREAVGLDGHIDSLLRAVDEIVIERFTRDLEISARAGLLRPGIDARAAALFVMGGVQKLALDALTREQTVDLAQLSMQATRLHLLGLLSEEVK